MEAASPTRFQQMINSQERRKLNKMLLNWMIVIYACVAMRRWMKRHTRKRTSIIKNARPYVYFCAIVPVYRRTLLIARFLSRMSPRVSDFHYIVVLSRDVISIQRSARSSYIMLPEALVIRRTERRSRRFVVAKDKAHTTNRRLPCA